MHVLKVVWQSSEQQQHSLHIQDANSPARKAPFTLQKQNKKNSTTVKFSKGVNYYLLAGGIPLIYFPRFAFSLRLRSHRSDHPGQTHLSPSMTPCCDKTTTPSKD